MVRGLLVFTVLTMASGLKVAVIGGGISGLSCARRLHELGHSATVMDTGKRAIGGRCSSRAISVGDERVVFDHSAQMISLSAAGASSPFGDVVHAGVASGALREWNAENLGVLSRADGGSEFELTRGALSEGGTRFFAGADDGMAALPKLLAEALPRDAIQRPVWVSKMVREGRDWRCFHYDRDLGTFGAVVIAHNGKCAARLTQKSGIDGVNRLLRTKFAPAAPRAGGGQLHLSSLWVLCVALRGMPAPAREVEGAVVEGCETLSWVARTDAKRGAGCGCLSTWTLVSTRGFGSANKVGARRRATLA
jgi:predicted NAD/FAD-dependent oxidoreductase